MTLNEFQKKLELVNQIKNLKEQQKKSSNTYNINDTSTIQVSSNLPVKTNIKTKSKNTTISSSKNEKSWLEEFASNIFQKASNLEDGYQAGDLLKTAGASVADVGLNIYSSVAKGMEGISKLMALGVAQGADWLGKDKFADAMRKEIANEQNDAYLSPKVDAFREKYIEPYSVLGSSSDQVSSGVGSTIFAAATSSIPGIGSKDIGKLKNVPIAMGLSEMGNSVAENYSKEDITDAQAWLNGAGKGTVSAISESIFGAFGVGGSELDDVLVKNVTKNVNSQLVKGMAQLGIKAGGEAAEEFLEYAGGYLTNLATDYISHGKGAEFYQQWNSDEVLQSMLTSFISTGITQGGGTVNNLVKGNDVVTGNSKQVQAQIDQEVNNQRIALEQKGEKVNTAKLLQIENEVTEKVYLDNAKQEMKKNIEENSNIDNTMKKGIYNAIDSSKDIKQLNVLSNVVNSYNSQNNNQTKNIVPTADDISRQEYLDSAKQYNIDTNNEVVNSIYELAAKRGVKVRYNDTAFSDNSQTALWKVDENGNREVVINPKAKDSGKVLQSLTIHELTHDMENTDAYNSLAEIVIDYAKKQNNYDKAYQDLSNMYAKEYQNYKGEEFTSRINQELVADVLGEKLGNQEFINHLVSSNTQTANGVYSWVVDKLNKLNKLTGYKFEKLYWTDVKNKFENAFNSNFNNYTNDIKYAINNIAKFDEIKYNNAKEVRLSKQNYGILMHAISSDTSIVPGLNKITLFDYEVDKYVTYTFYYKNEVEKPKVIKRVEHNNIDYFEEEANEHNKSSSKSSERNEESRSRQTDNKWNNDRFNYGETTNADAKISNINTREESVKERSDRKSTGNQSRIEIGKELDQSSSFLSNEFDNKGRKLSQQQQEYFKDVSSEVRDDKGNLKRFYHGTRSNLFNIFDLEKTGASNSDASVGFWFTESQEGAKKFADSVWYGNNKEANTFEVYLNLKNPKIYESVDYSKQLDKINNRLKEIKNRKNELTLHNIYLEIYERQIEWYDESEFSKFASEVESKEENRKKLIKDAKEYKELINEEKRLYKEHANLQYGDAYELFRTDIYKLAGKDADFANTGGTGMYLENKKEIINKYREMLKSQGYDGVVIKNTVYDSRTLGENNTQYLVFDSNQIKNIDNTNPTDSDDIRYSKESNGEYQKFLQDNFSNNGTKTTMSEVLLPSKISNLKNELRDMINKSTTMDNEMKQEVIKQINETDSEFQLQSYKEDLQASNTTENVPIKGTIKVNNYKNAKLNQKVVKNALSMVKANNQNKRTKSQWLQVAEQIGMNIKEGEVEKYAYKTWNDLHPNQKNNLNRQGERYVPFSKDEWMKAIEDGYYKANIEVEGITQEESENISKVLEDKDIASKDSDTLWNELLNNSSEQAKYILTDKNMEVKQDRKNTKVVSNDASAEVSRSGNIYLEGTKPTAQDFNKIGLENHFKVGDKRLVPVDPKRAEKGYKAEEWVGNQWVSEENPNIETLKEKNQPKTIDLLNEKSPTLEFLKETRDERKPSFKKVMDAFMQKVVNSGHYVDEIAKQTNNKELKYANDKRLSTFGEAQYSIGIAQTNNNGEEIGKSLIDIFKPAKEAGLKEKFNDYLLNKLNLERQAVEKSVFGDKITSEESRQIIKQYEQLYPQFKEWSEDVYKFNRNELQNLVDAGFISEETQELFRNLYGNYVPIHRILEETYDKASKTNKETGATSPIKKAKGGYQQILDIETSMAENVLANKKAIRMNELGIQLAISTGHKEILDDMGYQPKWTPDAIVSLNGDVVITEDGKYLYTIYTNGEMKQFRLTKELYESLRKDTIQNKINNSEVAKAILTPFEKATKFQRDMLTTYSVGFALNNPIKDFQDGIFYTKYGTGTFLKNYTVALQEIANKGEHYKKYMALGGIDNSYFDYNKGMKSEAKGIKKLFDKVQQVNRILETAPRLAEYISSIESGASQNEAMYNAADITTNFKRGGEYTKLVNKYGANFLNASVQGLDKFVRTFTNVKNTQDGLKLVAKVASMGVLPTILNALLYAGDDDYEDLEDYIKDEYYLLKVSDEGDFVRIPKGRVFATISSATRTIMDGIKNGELDIKGFTDEVTKQLAPNNPLEDNLLAPVIQVANNKTWYGTDLVPTRLQNQLPKNQYNEKTDKISLWLGENLNISPIKINYLIDQYSGGIGDVLLPMLTPQAENNIITDKFTTSSVMKNKNVGEFYDALDEYEKLSNDSEATEEQKTKYTYLSKISSKVGKLYEQKRKIQMDESLTDKEKKELIKEVQREINAYTECAIDNINGEYNEETQWNMYVDGIISDKVRESDGNSALQDALYIVNNGVATKKEYMEMYQLSKDNGTSIPTMETLVKLKENKVKLTAYTDFKIGTKDFKSDRDEENKAISGSLSAKKATYIMDMDTTKEQKNGLLNVLSEGASYEDLKKLNGNYSEYFQQSGKRPESGGLSAREKYMSLIDAGMSVDTVNEFYNQIGNISALKDINGKTISGSKKQLVFNFVNSLKLSIPQKMILLSKQYKSFAKLYIKDILGYITTLKASKKEKIKLIYSIFV